MPQERDLVVLSARDRQVFGEVRPVPAAAAYLIEPLDRRHDRRSFASGQPDMGRHLKQQAGQDSRRHVAATFVTVERSATVAAGYHSLSAAGVPPREDLPPETAARFPRYPLLPATPLGRLAVDRAHRVGSSGSSCSQTHCVGVSNRAKRSARSP